MSNTISLLNAIGCTGLAVIALAGARSFKGGKGLACLVVASALVVYATALLS